MVLINRKLKWVYLVGLLFPSLCQASFIETTMGAAVLNDATAAYFNPAALVLLPNTQLIPLVTGARFKSQFTGQSTAVATGFSQYGSSSSATDYFSPSFYAGLPTQEKVVLGFSIVSNFANRDPEQNSILRYVQSSNSIQDYDVVPAIGFKVNDYLGLGGGINFSYTSFSLHPITGFPGSNVADSESNNQSTGTGVGANAGFLLRPTPSTLIGFNYRTLTKYNESGSSVLNGPTKLISNNYHYEMRTPAHSILSISQRIGPQFGLIGTVRRTYWSIIRNVNIYNIATATSSTPVIVNASVPYYLHNTWMLTFGGNYRFNPSWIVRLAATYSQSPDSGFYQVSTGDSYILGTSVGYTINKTFVLDGSYAHAFIQNQQINISGNRFNINGTNSGLRDVVSVKLTVNI